jgi:phytoene desaturase
MIRKKIAVIGSGFSGLSAACYLAQRGYYVTIFEKNQNVGGRARMFESNGFKFDMGPSWYWMPDVFDRFFADFDKKTNDFYELIKLSPGFQIVFQDGSNFTIENDESDLKQSFENLEKGSGEKLTKFLNNAAYKYKISMADLVFKPSHNFVEFLRWDIINEVFKTNLFSPLSLEIRKLFKNQKLRQILEFPVIFLGAMADRIPALYSIMNYAAMVQGTYYPQGGMVRIVEAMESLARSLGVEVFTNSPISKIEVVDGIAKGVRLGEDLLEFDAIISSADYHHTEMNLLDSHYRNYTESYWEKKVFAPSSVLFYLGLNKKVDNLIHHNLFFDTDYDAHAKDIYENPKWTNEPLFYVCCPSKTDEVVAPKGHENLFILIPHAIQLAEDKSIVEHYFQTTIQRIERYTGESIAPHIIFKKEFTARNFIEEYHSYKGNAYGLANTLMQTAFFKPKIRNKKVKNLFYTGQLTVPGPGVPPAIISGKIVAKELHNYLSQTK